jgi:hypothetical protein
MTDHTPGQFCTDPCTVCNDRPTTHTYWLSIGRNVGDCGDKLTTGEWYGFHEQVRIVIGCVNGDIVTEVAGESEWCGNREETHLFLVTVPAANVDGLRRYLRRLANDYRQDAIGMVGGAGTDTLIGGE